MTGAKHLLLTPHGYTLRVKVPRDLRERIGKREIKKSLSTFNMSHAIKVAGYLMLEIKHVFSVMRGVGVGKRQKFNLPITEMIRRGFDADGRVQEELEMSVQEYRELFPDYQQRSCFAPPQISSPTPVAQAPIQTTPVLPVQSESAPSTPQTATFGVVDEIFSIRAAQHIKEKKKKRVSANRLASLRSLYDMLIDYFGDVPMRAVTRNQAAEFIDLLSVLPIGATNNRIKEFKNKSIREIAAQTAKKLEDLKEWKPGRKKSDQVKLLGAATVNKFISEADAFWEWCQLQDRFLNNPFGKQKIKQSGGPKREPFDVRHLETIFRHSIFSEHNHSGTMLLHEHHFFAPLIAVYSGLRAEEICQLHLTDIVKLHGIWVFDINRLEDKRLKNDPSERRVPIHNDLIQLGLLEYANELRREGEKILFPGLLTTAVENAEEGEQKLANNLSSWFRLLLIKLEIKKSTLVFHSFRHTFANAYHQALYAHPTVVKDLLGHIHEDITKDIYSSAYGIKTLKDTIDALPLNTDLKRPGFAKPWRLEDFRLAATLRRLRREAEDPYLAVRRKELAKASELFFNSKPVQAGVK